MTDVRLSIGEYTALRSCASGLTLFNRLDFCVGHALLNHGDFSPGEREMFSGLIRPHDVVIEAGAHIGTHTVALSKMGKAVHAFEPQRLVFQTLCGNLALNECRNVHAYHAAVGKADGHILVPFERPDKVGNTGGVLLSGVTEGERVPIVTLDSTGLDCDFLKADVEEMELDVILGAQKLIQRCHPILYLESNHSHRSLVDLVDSLGYAMYWHCPKIVRGEDSRLGGIVSINLLCFPFERLSEAPERARIKLDDECIDLGVQKKPPEEVLADPVTIGEPA